MSSSAQCRKEIATYQGLYDQIHSLNSNFRDCKDALEKGREIAKNVIINNETIDKGLLTEIRDIIRNSEHVFFVTLMDDCCYWIEYWEAELQEALKREAAERAARTRLNNIER